MKPRHSPDEVGQNTDVRSMKPRHSPDEVGQIGRKVSKVSKCHNKNLWIFFLSKKPKNDSKNSFFCGFFCRKFANVRIFL